VEIKIEPGMNLSLLMNSFCSGWFKRPKTVTTIDGERAKVLSEVMCINNEHNRQGRVVKASNTNKYEYMRKYAI
jgi:hypothetical protein